jgi:hypothetical protein
MDLFFKVTSKPNTKSAQSIRLHTSQQLGVILTSGDLKVLKVERGGGVGDLLEGTLGLESKREVFRLDKTISGAETDGIHHWKPS